MSKKMVFKSIMEDEKMKIRAMKAVAGSGVDSVEVNMEEGTLTASGDADPVYLAKKLRKVGCRAQLQTVAPVEDEKKDEKKDAEEVAEEAAPSVVYNGIPPPVVYNAYASGYGYPSYMVVGGIEYPNGWMTLL